ncbi:putative NADH dehydrogenase protein, partial [Naja naja]
SPHWHDGEFRQDDGPANGRGNFFRALDPETNMTVVIPNGNEGLRRENP